MSEFKGTKGKWSTQVGYDSKYAQAIININAGDSINGLATIWSGEQQICDMTKADAQLICKAPELLKMLNSVLELQKTNYGNGMNTHLALISKAKEIETLIKEATEL